MKISAVIFVLCAAVGAVRADGSGRWAPKISPEELSSATPPAPGTPSKAVPRDGANYSAAEEMLIKEFGVIGISLDIPETEVTAQMYGYANRVNIDNALRRAVNSFFEDHKDPGCPLYVILAGMGASVDNPTKSQVNQAKQKLLQLMNMPGSLLRLVREGGPDQAGHGEKVSRNWIFSLHLDYSTLTCWAVVDRSGEKPAYTYGLK